MYLKSIEVQGFKSFAEKICFEFHNGITGIVGPNGSGKSNVADAVRWVLGEQSAKQLRGGNMQDVIFSGTENRRPLGYASVAITLENGDHKLPVPFDEVTVLRRLYRSGESEYRINGSVCRLKDIQEMFYDTGIGKEGYSIIGQGQIDRILSGKPEDRRDLFDEAAGIVKFKRRKNLALKKLEGEKQNLLRVADILQELSRQLGPLERQAEAARVYLDKKEELKRLDVQVFLLETEHIRRQLKDLSEKSALAKENLMEASGQFEQARQEYEALDKRMEELEEKSEQARKQAQENALRCQQMKGQENVLREQIRTGKTNNRHYQNRLSVIEREQQDRAEALESCAAQKGQLHQALENMRGQSQEKQEELDRLQQAIRAFSQEIEDGKNEIIEILNRRANTKGEIQRYDTMMEQVEIQKAALNQKALRLKGEEAKLEGSAKETQEAYADIQTQKEQLLQKNGRADEEIRRLDAQIKEQNWQQEAQKAAYHKDVSRLESLRNLAERYDGYGGSIRRVMERKKEIPGIQGVVADLIQVDKDYETAIETALGGSIQHIVTDHEQTAKGLIEYLKKNRYGRATFLPLTSIRSRGSFSQEAALKETGAVGLASSLVQTAPEYRELVNNLLGRTLVVKEMDSAIAIGQKYRHTLRMVTLEGESFGPGGSMTGGSYRNNSNLLGRRREIEELAAKVKSCEEALAKIQAELKAAREERDRQQEAQAAAQKELQEISLRLHTLQLQRSQQKEKEQEFQSRRRRIDRESLEIKQQIRELEENTASIQKELEKSGQEEINLEALIQERQRELEKARQEAQGCQKKIEELHLRSSALEQKESYLDTDTRRIGQEQEKLQEEQRQIEENLRIGQQEIRQKEAEVSQIQEERRQAERNAAESQAQVQEQIKAKEEMSKNHKVLFQKREDFSKQMRLLDKEVFRLDSQIEKLEEDRESRVNGLWEEYGLTPNTALPYAAAEESRGREDLKKAVSRLRDEIRALGEVNVNAVEDYKELQKRHAFLSAQHADLVTAEKTLLQIVEDLDSGMRRQFAEKFRQIQREFDKAFQDLFGGGNGTLKLSDGADILEAGIQIISQPPGKKLQNMMQLSGGEKALTAIALLFAIQNLKPSPFCLLDEIEAALDDSNVVRFAEYVHKLTKNTQFIIITHRRGTMHAADRLYGITMQEKGVSALVSVDLVERDLEEEF